MTESEAIKICNTIVFATSFSNPKGVSLNTTKEELTEAIRMSIQALEKQIEMKKYCDENGCSACPYHNPTLKDNRCMNDFIIDKE